MGARVSVQTTCAECGAPLDSDSIALVRLHPERYPAGIIGECCAPHGADNGWGDAPRYVDGPSGDYDSCTGYGYT